MSVSGREALPDFRECLGDPPGCPLMVARPSRIRGGVQDAHPDGCVAFPDVRECLSDPPGWSGGPP